MHCISGVRLVLEHVISPRWLAEAAVAAMAVEARQSLGDISAVGRPLTLP